METGMPGAAPLAWSLLRLARPAQWGKSAFVLVGPLFALADAPSPLAKVLPPALLAAAAFATTSSACYIVNDILDAPKDRHHPRKRLRPIASGAVSPRLALVFAALFLVIAAAAVLALPLAVQPWVAAVLGLYAANVTIYSLWLKHRVIADVVCLSLGFVLRVFGGCAAVGIAPTTWLLNATLFLAMFLAFGKRLGERRTLGPDAAAARTVQAGYTDDLLRMAVVVTGVATLVIYAAYVQSREAWVLDLLARIGHPRGAWFNVLWLTMLPATYALLRSIVLLERGRFDDPTELAVKDRATQLAGLLFVLIVVGLIALTRV